MDAQTYEQHKQTLAEGRIIIVGGRSAASLAELDWLRDIGAREDGTTDVVTTAATHTLTQEQLAAVIDGATHALRSDNADLADEVERLNEKADGLQDALAKAGADARAKDATLSALQSTVEAQSGQAESLKAQIESQKAQIEAVKVPAAPATAPVTAPAQGEAQAPADKAADKAGK